MAQLSAGEDFGDLVAGDGGGGDCADRGRDGDKEFCAGT